MAWNEQILDLIRDREELDLASLDREFSICDPDERPTLVDCLTVFGEEYNVPMGLLRPADPLRVFIEPPPSRNPLSWFFNRAAIEDRTSELSYRLKRQRMSLGVAPVPPQTPRTVGDFVRAWLGKDQGA